MRTPNDFPDRATSPYSSARFHLGDAFALLALHYDTQFTTVRSVHSLTQHAGHDVDPRPLYEQINRLADDATVARDLFEQYVWALAGDPKAKAAVLTLLGVNPTLDTTRPTVAE